MIDENLYEREIRLLERKIREKNYDNPVVFYGSSSIRLWKTLESDFPEYRILNLGFGGSTLEYCLYYFDRLIKPINVASFILYAGDNDVGEGRTADEIFDSLASIYEKFRQHFPGVNFTCLSIKPSVSRIDKIETIREANKLIKEFLSSKKNSFFLNVFNHMIDDDLKVKKEYFTLDNLHMNSNGYMLWKNILKSESQKIF